MSPSRIRVLLADDHPVVREGLAAIIDRQPDMRVAAHASNGRQACELSRSFRPDVVLMDLRMPVMDGLQATRALCRDDPACRVIVLTTYDGDEEIAQALRAGASGYLLKGSGEDRIVASIREAFAGRRVIPPEVAMRLADRYPVSEPTGRELEVLGLIVSGRSNKEIGRVLGITEATVKSHVNRLLEKLGADDRTQAATVALRRGFFRLEDGPACLHRKLEKSP